MYESQPGLANNPSVITVCDIPVKTVNEFAFLGSITTQVPTSDLDIQTKIGKGSSAFAELIKRL